MRVRQRDAAERCLCALETCRRHLLGLVEAVQRRVGELAGRGILPDIFPERGGGSDAMLLSFVSFSITCIIAGSAWIAAGAVLHSAGTSRMHLHHFYRGEAFLLAGFAIMILLSAYYAS